MPVPSLWKTDSHKDGEAHFSPTRQSPSLPRGVVLRVGLQEAL
jgi:hypothetical protein